jgi:DNA polymerase-4
LIPYTVFTYSVVGVPLFIFIFFKSQNEEVMSSPKSRKIIHCDADCFFAAIEMRDDPSLKGIPIAVGVDPSRRGVISTCNYEARAFGVHSALASAYAKKLCPQLIILPHKMAKYRLAALQIKAIFYD